MSEYEIYSDNKSVATERLTNEQNKKLKNNDFDFWISDSEQTLGYLFYFLKQ